MELEKKGGASFPSNYVTIHQLKQRWFQQQQSSSNPAISQSNNHNESSSEKPQNDAVFVHPPPQPVTKSSSKSINKNEPPPAISQPNNHNDEIALKTHIAVVGPCIRRGRKPKPKPKPKPTDEVTDSANYVDVVNSNPNTHQPINNNEKQSKKKKKKSRKPKGVFTDQNLTGASNPEPGLELDQNNDADNVVEPEPKLVMEVVVVEKKQPREPRKLDKKVVREFKAKKTSFGQNNDAGVNVVDSVNVVDGDGVKENSRRGSGRFNHQGKGQGKQSLKTAPFDHHQDMNDDAFKGSDVNNNNVSNWRRGSGRVHHHHQGIPRPWNSKPPPFGMKKEQVWVKKRGL